MYEARSFKNSRRRLPFITESQNHGESIVPIPSCQDKKYEYAVNAALTQFRMHPVRVASFKKYESLNDHENTILFSIFFSFFLSRSLSLSLSLSPFRIENQFLIGYPLRIHGNVIARFSRVVRVSALASQITSDCRKPVVPSTTAFSSTV